MEPRILNGVIFLDAAQRLHKALEAGTLTAKSNEERLAFVEKLLRETSAASPLLEGAEKEVMGEAWSRFLHSRNPADVEDFITRLSSSSLAQAIKQFNPVSELNETYKNNPKSIVGALFGPNFFSLGHQLKQMAQDSKMVDYTKGESFSSAITKLSSDIRKERGLPPPKPPEEPMSSLPASLMLAAKKSEVFRG